MEVIRKRDKGGKKGGSKEDPEETTRETGGKPENILPKSQGERVFEGSAPLCQNPSEVKEKKTEIFSLYLLSLMGFERRVLVE